MSVAKPLQRGALLALTWMHFLNDSYASFLSPLLPLIVKKLELSLTLAGMLAATSSVVSALFQPLFGIIADRLRHRTFILIAPMFTSLGMSALGLAPSYPLLLLCLIIGGLGVAAFHPQATAAAGQFSGDQKGLGISLFIFGGSLGFALGPLVITGLVSLWGLERSYLAAIPGLISLLLSARFVPWREKRGLRQQKQERSLAPFLRQIRPLGLLYGIV
ncbi:MAG: MFS transporter, partial [Nitrospinota bacterium]